MPIIALLQIIVLEIGCKLLPIYNFWLRDATQHLVLDG